MDTLLDTAVLPPEPSYVRLAGIADIPAVARITQEGPPRVDVDPEVVARATRLLLTHVAFEHGALWVEHAAGGEITRAVAVVPGAETSPWEHVDRTIAVDVAVMSPPDPGVGRALQAELAAARPSWVLSEISSAVSRERGHGALLEAAVTWAREQVGHESGPLAVVADSLAEIAAAQSLGFVERSTSEHPGWWLGVSAGPWQR